MRTARMFLHPAPHRLALDALVEKSIAHVDTLTPQEREAMIEAQNRNLAKNDDIWD